jgi:pimeloyl-ACP methyl ester carboxylesterase
MPSQYGSGFTHVGEGYFLRGTTAAFWSRRLPVPVVFYWHGATGTAGSVISNAAETAMIRALARNFLVVAADFGGDTFANDTAIARMEEARLAVLGRDDLNVDQSAPIGFVGTSMGAGCALAYTLAYPQHVGYVAGIIPGLDWNDVVVNNRLGLAAAVNAAYGGSYNDSVHGPLHSPVRFAANLPADLPIHLWTSSNDTAAVPATATAFIDARPQTGRTNLGAVGHSPDSVAYAVNDVAAFCREHGGVLG